MNAMAAQQSLSRPANGAVQARSGRSGLLGAAKRIYHAIRIAKWLIFHTPPMNLDTPDYDAYWKDKRSRDHLGVLSNFQQQRADWIMPRIEPGAAVLDIGCGDGALLAYLTGVKGIKPMGADISDYTLEFMREKGIEAFKFDMKRLQDLDDIPEADYVVMFEVLEHIQNPELLLRKAFAKARKAVFFSVPNSGYFPYRIRLAWGSFPMQWRLHPGEHLRYWTYGDMQWWLSELGYGGKSTLDAYEGFPVLNRISKGLFGMGLIGEIRC